MQTAKRSSTLTTSKHSTPRKPTHKIATKSSNRRIFTKSHTPLHKSARLTPLPPDLLSTNQSPLENNHSSPSHTNPIKSAIFHKTTPALNDEIWKHERALDFSDDIKGNDIKLADQKGINWKSSNVSPQSYYQMSKTKINIARYFADVNSQRPVEYWDYHNYTPPRTDPGNYLVGEKLGQGKFSEVYEAVEGSSGKQVVVKVLKPVRKEKIKRETLILQHLKGCPYISSLYDVARDPASRTVSLIFEHQANTPYKELYDHLTLDDIKLYTYQLLVAVDYTHRRGIMHRDIKPGNILIDTQKKHARLSDWGLAEFYHPHAEYHVRVATKGYKAPELLLNLQDYDYAVDMWAFGTTLAQMLFKFRVIAPSSDDLQGIRQMAKFSGSEPIYEYLDKYKIQNLSKNSFAQIGSFPVANLVSFVTKDNIANITDEGLDLVKKMLVVDHWNRIPAHMALRHPFFDSVRQDPAIVAATGPYINQSTIF